jgi:ArsR family transcriptional regulator, cadmium/lead-responsive transcriptional repressor
MKVGTASLSTMSEETTRTAVTARFFKGLSDPTRLRIIDLLIANGSMNVTEIVEQLGQPQGRVSSHLACLRWCGFVLAERSGRYVEYRVVDESVGQLVAIAHELITTNAEHIMSCTRLR